MTTSSQARRASVDPTPWSHPFLETDAIRRFKQFSERVWEAAFTHRRRTPRRLDAAFAVNMAQTMYKWGQITARQGHEATLYLHPQDQTALSRPEWEEFDGSYADIFNGPAFLAAHPDLTARIPTIVPPNEGSELLTAYHPASGPVASAELRRRSPSVRHADLLELSGMYPYFTWAEMLAKHDVIAVASLPFPAFASGKPYCIFSVGGDLQFDCGRTDSHGEAMRRSFAGAKFILASNPHTLGHCRRLGLTNAVYFPFAMDSGRYSPGDGAARAEWQQQLGGDTFVLASARIDSNVKGHTPSMLDAVFRAAAERPNARFIFLGWGADVGELQRQASERGLGNKVIVLPPVGKTRLIDYYRSADVVLDTFVYGYMGATALEAAAIAKPVVMKLRHEHYHPLYSGDVAPVEQASTPDEVFQVLRTLLASPALCRERGKAMREWLIRNHGEERTGPLLSALLQFAADARPLPAGADNPLNDALSPQETAYHEACLR